jgi:hypothetical protein
MHKYCLKREIIFKKYIYKVLVHLTVAKLKRKRCWLVYPLVFHCADYYTERLARLQARAVVAGNEEIFLLAALRDEKLAFATWMLYYIIYIYIYIYIYTGAKK